jgi:acyl-CoA reductase-like NAD-dependent aldehyde dehydrogenase
MGVEDVDSAVQAAHTAFQTFGKTNPRARARLLLRWDELTRENKEDLAKILVVETGKPLKEALVELDYALGFTWWFAVKRSEFREIFLPPKPLEGAFSQLNNR